MKKESEFMKYLWYDGETETPYKDDPYLSYWWNFERGHYINKVPESFESYLKHYFSDNSQGSLAGDAEGQRKFGEAKYRAYIKGGI